MKVAVIGAGFMGGVHAACYGKIADVEVAAVVDVRPEQREKLAKEAGARPFESWDPVLQDETIDIVDCCLPTFRHRDCVVAACEAGKHVLCEKPFAMSVAECEEMIAASERANKRFMIAQVVRFFAAYAVTKQLVDAGTLGQPQAIVAHRLSAPPLWSQDNWLLQPQKSLGAVVDLQLHDLDYVRYLLGDPRSIYTTALRSATGSVDYVLSNLAYDGALAFTESSFLMPPNWPFRATLRIVGTEATLELDGTRDPMLWVTDGKGEVSAPPLPEKDGYEAEIEYFVDAVRNDRPLTIAPPADSKQSLRLALCSKESAETGRVVAF